MAVVAIGAIWPVMGEGGLWEGLGDWRVARWVGLGVEDTHTKFHPFLTGFRFLGIFSVITE